MQLKQAEDILNSFSADGFQAYIVGGAVRDMLLGACPEDYDIATDAGVGDICRIAEKMGWKIYHLGAAFGVVGVGIGGRMFEIATFRSETYGQDSHRPEAVVRVGTLEEDLARRDFTINAMAMNSKGDVIDIFGGQQDLTAKLIKTVGDPVRRFEEDALRMFRAARFAAKLGFELHSSLYPAAAANLYRVRGLSVERVRDELNKAIIGPWPDKGFDFLIDTGLIRECCAARYKGQQQTVEILPELAKPDEWRLVKGPLRAAEPRLEVRWAVLLHHLGSSTGVIVTRLRLPATQAARISWLIRHQAVLPVPQKPAVISWLAGLAAGTKNLSSLQLALDDLYALRMVLDLKPLQEASYPVGLLREMTKQILTSTPFFAEQLPVTGQEIANCLGGGPQVKEFQKRMLADMQQGVIPFTREAMLEQLCSVSNGHK